MWRAGECVGGRVALLHVPHRSGGGGSGGRHPQRGPEAGGGRPADGRHPAAGARPRGQAGVSGPAAEAGDRGAAAGAGAGGGQHQVQLLHLLHGPAGQPPRPRRQPGRQRLRVRR